MAKKRKTRQEKISSDLRPQASGTIGAATFSYSRPTSHSQTIHPDSLRATAIGIHTTDYSYVGKDLRHTALITGAIILAELVIFFFIRSI